MRAYLRTPVRYQVSHIYVRSHARNAELGLIHPAGRRGKASEGVDLKVVYAREGEDLDVKGR